MRYFRNALLLLFALSACPAFADSDDEYESQAWKELEVPLPDAPKQKDLVPFYASAATDNRFFVDASTLSVSADGVVRYVLVVVSPQGVRNVTFEGMRCETRERRIYASGRSDGSWSKARKNEWSRIEDEAANRHHAALSLEYFCPFGIVVKDAAEARNALLQGGHPDIRH